MSAKFYEKLSKQYLLFGPGYKKYILTHYQEFTIKSLRSPVLVNKNSCFYKSLFETHISSLTTFSQLIRPKYQKAYLLIKRLIFILQT